MSLTVKSEAISTPRTSAIVNSAAAPFNGNNTFLSISKCLFDGLSIHGIDSPSHSFGERITLIQQGSAQLVSESG